MDQVPAGWYADPGGSGSQRYWDGQQWTHHLRPEPDDVALARLPPPSGVAVDDRSDWVQTAEVERVGSKRGRLVLAAVLLPLLIAAAVVAILTGSGGTSASGDRMADLREPPEVVWSLTDPALFDELIVDLDRRARSETWLPTAQEIRAEGVTELADQGRVVVLGTAGDLAVIQPMLYDIAGPLLGIDLDSGEQVWSSGLLDHDGPDGAWVRCGATVADRAVCLSGWWDDDHGAQRAVLRSLSLADGAVLWQQELASSETEHHLAAGAFGAVITQGSDEQGITVTRYGAAAEVLWEQNVPGDPWSIWTEVVGDLVLVQSWTGDFQGTVLDLSTGELRQEFLSPGSGNAVETSYLEQDSQLLRQELRDGGRVGTLAGVDDDGREVWRASVEGRVLQPDVLEPGAPVLVREEDSGAIRAIDPRDGEELWSARLAGGSVTAVLSSSRDIVLVDERDIVVLDASSGDERWARRHSFDGWLRPVSAAQSLVYVLEDGFRMRAYDLQDGSERWSRGVPDGHSPARLQAADGAVLLVRNEALHRLG